MPVGIIFESINFKCKRNWIGIIRISPDNYNPRINKLKSAKHPHQIYNKLGPANALCHYEAINQKLGRLQKWDIHTNDKINTIPRIFANGDS